MKTQACFAPALVNGKPCSVSKDPAFIYLSPPDVGSAERDAILRAFDSGWIAPVGEELDKFEAELAAYVGGPAAVAVSSGTAALRLALALHDVGPGDEVVVPTATFAASAFAVCHAGARPVFIDSDPTTWCLDVEMLAEFLETRAGAGALPKAVMPVALYGSTPNYARLREVCSKFSVPIVEDAAEALGSISDCGAVGSHDHPAIFSFNGNKIITSSSGGAFVGSRDAVERVRFLATQAREPVLYYEHREVGYNFRLSNLLAALARAQLQRLGELIDCREQTNQRYVAALPEVSWCPYTHTTRPNHWLSVALLPDGFDSTAIAEGMIEAGVEARPAWKPMHLQPVFTEAETVGSGKVAETLFSSGLCLPSGSSLTPDQQTRVIKTFYDVTGLR